MRIRDVDVIILLLLLLYQPEDRKTIFFQRLTCSYTVASRSNGFGFYVREGNNTVPAEVMFNFRHF